MHKRQTRVFRFAHSAYTHSMPFNKAVREERKKVSIKQEKSIRKGTICLLELYRFLFRFATSSLLSVRFAVPLTCCNAVFVWKRNTRHTGQKRMRPSEFPVNADESKNNLKVLKLSQRAEAIWREEKKSGNNNCADTEYGRPYQMNERNWKREQTCNAHKKKPSKCKCHWWAWTHQLTWKRYARLRVLLQRSNMHQLTTDKTQQTLIPGW